MKILINITQLVTVAANKYKRGTDMNNIGIIYDGCVVINGEIIEFVGTTKQAALLYDFNQHQCIDCSNKTVIPGFVDSHTHLVFAGERSKEFNMRLCGATYSEIMANGGGIVSSTLSTRNASAEQLTLLATQRLNQMLVQGVTTIEAKSGYGLDTQTEIKQLTVVKNLQHNIEIVSTFMGAHAVPAEYKANKELFIKLIIDDMLPKVVNDKLAQFCDVFCDQGAFSIDESRAIIEAANKLGLTGKLHADEIANTNAAQLAVNLKCVSADHLLKVSEDSITALSNSDTVATLLPLTAFCLREPYANARKLIDNGCIVAVATDFNPGSCYCNNIPLLIALSTMYMGMTINETISALTINGAAAIGKADVVGSIEKNKQADITILNCPSIEFLNYNTANNFVETVIKKGKIAFQAGN